MTTFEPAAAPITTVRVAPTVGRSPNMKHKMRSALRFFGRQQTRSILRSVAAPAAAPKKTYMTKLSLACARA
jgi:hypothetical protein